MAVTNSKQYLEYGDERNNIRNYPLIDVGY